MVRNYGWLAWLADGGPRSWRSCLCRDRSPLTAFSDGVQSLLVFSGALAFVPLALRGRGRPRLFWALIVLGLTFWLAYQLFWTYKEVVPRRWCRIFASRMSCFFVHMVPLMAALGIRPQFARDEYSARVVLDGSSSLSCASACSSVNSCSCSTTPGHRSNS